jgi:hypothetical protein
VIDEAGMIGSRQLSRFVNEAEARGVKIVLVGDPEQLQAIGAGAPFRAIAEQIGHAELSEIRRQRMDWQREVSVVFATHRTAEGLAAYEQHGAIRLSDSREGGRSEIVRDYLADREQRPEGTRVAMAHRRADVRALNEGIRSELQERGALARGEDAGALTFQTNDGKREFAPGDRVVFLENNRDLGVKNGMFGTVEAIEPGRMVARLDGPARSGEESVRAVTVTMNDYNAIDPGYATTIHKTQGATVDRKALQDEGQEAEDIAARFGVSPAIVTQRLKLTAVSPKLMKAYRAEGMNLGQLSAFAITDDHGLQERVWKEMGGHASRRDILNALTEEQVPTSDRRAVFVGLDVYEDAGGTIARDLFDDKGGGFLIDTDLLEHLVTEKLEKAAQTLVEEGWKWLETVPSLDYGATARMRRVYPEHATPDEATQASIDELEAKLEALTEVSEEYDETIEAEISRLEAELEALRGEVAFQPGDIGRADVIVSLSHSGEVRIERGFVRPEDDTPDDDGEEPVGEKPVRDKDALSDSLVVELSAYRTAALSNELAAQPELALRVLVHALAVDAFYRGSQRQSVLTLRVTGPSPQRQCPCHRGEPRDDRARGTAGRMGEPHAGAAGGVVGFRFSFAGGRFARPHGALRKRCRRCGRVGHDLRHGYDCRTGEGHRARGQARYDRLLAADSGAIFREGEQEPLVA